MVKGYIYKILDNETGKYYIGSSMSKYGMNQRKSQHKNDYLRYWNGELNYRTYFDVMINDDYEYEILHEIADCNKEDLFDCECIYINNSLSFNDGCVNRSRMLKRFNRIQEEAGWII